MGKELERAVYRHASLYIEADKQALYGKRRKTAEYIRKKIKHAQKKLQEDKKVIYALIIDLILIMTILKLYYLSCMGNSFPKQKCFLCLSTTELVPVDDELNQNKFFP